VRVIKPTGILATFPQRAKSGTGKAIRKSAKEHVELIRGADGFTEVVTVLDQNGKYRGKKPASWVEKAMRLSGAVRLVRRKRDGLVATAFLQQDEQVISARIHGLSTVVRELPQTYTHRASLAAGL